MSRIERFGAFARVSSWVAMARTPPARSGPRVFYGSDRIPSRAEFADGGLVRLQTLSEAFPNARGDHNILYLLSYRLPRDFDVLLRLSEWRGSRLVWDQDGVAYRGWHGDGWEKINRPLATGLHRADHVFYQSRFCKLSADKFLGERRRSWEILYNAVDTRRFVPASRRARPLTVLLGGHQHQRYRLECALRAFALVGRQRPDARLLVTGALSFARDAHAIARRLMFELGIQDRVELVGPYTQHEEPEILARADVLLHTKYNDPCPRTVIEAMACGLPVVYSGSGGVPELVGDDAGIGISAPLDWERDHPPEPAALAEAILRVADGHAHYSEAARQRAIDRFDIRPWLARHCEVFEALLDGRL